MVHAGVLFGGYSRFGAALTILLNQVAPEDLAALERVAKTIAAALPKDALSHLSHAVFAMSAADRLSDGGLRPS